ncbi:hypothetical protein OIHEL45_08455 [Sulfitobacter indolifex HEL-45]|uniref:Uncharacterized protein n=1 Tax=Sulfitobacter indolifex HEL-45 TaxID=391624 RepID=A0ABM9XBG5_9RHOB|nr:hypothetical protein OIHEL45_08455 [Sulfitobacter indolifex HEL-45]
MGCDLLLSGVVEIGHISVVKRVQTIGAIDIKGGAGCRRPVGAVYKKAFVDRMLDATDDAQFKTKRLGTQLKEFGNLAFD